jgi:predicted NUDIX family NTP pyrophosphohydrolase
VKRRSAGVLLRRGDGKVLLVHPGGPFWARRDAGAWSIPKGEHDEGADPSECARREFREELGSEAPAELVDLGTVTQSGGKEVRAFYGVGDLDVSAVVSNTFTIEWPPRSGRMQEFPEVDRAGWFDVDLARAKINPAQAAFLDRLP